MTSPTRHLQRLIQHATLPLSIHLSPTASRSYASAPPYLLHAPRLSYLPLLLPRLHAFFAPHLIDPALARDSQAWFEYQGVPLKWGWAVGLLFDLHAGVGGAAEEGVMGAWELTLHYGDFPEEKLVRLDDGGKVVWDSFVNAVKEADFVRNGSARAAMGLSLGDSEGLWRGVRENDWDLFNAINAKLLAPPGLPVKHVPIKFYLPAAATSQTLPEASEPQPGHIRVVQALVPLLLPSKQPQTLGTALNSVLPGIFPSRRAPLLAQPVLHGAVVPMGANLGELGKVAGFADGFLHVVVAMLG